MSTIFNTARQPNRYPSGRPWRAYAEDRSARHGWMTAIVMLVAGMSAPITAQAAIPAAERQALVNLYTSTNGAAWTNKSGWNGAPGTECTWHGVTCAGVPQHVTEIDLYNNKLDGPLPNMFASLGQLKRFDASLNHVTGSIPSLAGLTKLVAFYVYSNALVGSIPSFAGLTSLKYFFVHSNHLTGSIPSLADIPNLAFIYLDSNQLTGPVPSLANLTFLKVIRIDSNQLSGPMPSAPSAASLQRGESTLCSNHLDPVPNADWDAATGETPWYQNCTPMADEIFANGFEP